MKRLAFRFDIDTHKCIKGGVPKLLAVSEKYDAPFTFFLNCGKSVSVVNSLESIFFERSKKEIEKTPQMMSAMKKLGLRDYMIAALINPNISNYKSQINELLAGDCEVGLHGGRNHAIWGNKMEWTEEGVRQEIIWGLERIKQFDPNFVVKGFASPEWNSPVFLPKILKEKGFSYIADLRCEGKEPINNKGELPAVGVNLLGEPGGVAFFENCRVRGLNDNDIVRKVMDSFDRLNTVILYDHPYYAGLNEIGCISKIIRSAKNEGIQICKLEELL